MNFYGSYDWSALLERTSCLYDPFTGIQYCLMPVSSFPSLLGPSCYPSHSQVGEFIAEQTINSAREIPQGAPVIKKTSPNPRQKQTKEQMNRHQAARKYAIQKAGKKLERNSLTNVGNQTLIYAYMRRRCGELIQKYFPNLTEDELRSYFSFAKRVKASMLNYISLDKLRDAW